MTENALAALTAAAPKKVLGAIQKASVSTGVDFAYLMGKAAAESSFNPKAKARTSSATGLYQFIEKTWLSMVKKHGDKYGLGEYADKIDDSGRVKNSATRREILALRRDPEKSALLAAEFARENKRLLDQTWGGEVGATELYLAHFLGAGGAAAFLKARDDNPLQSGADLFPQAALSNRNVFYNSKTGQARSIEEIYAFFDRKFEAAHGHEVIGEPGMGLPDDDLSLLAMDGASAVPEEKAGAEEISRLDSFIARDGRKEMIAWSSARARPGAIAGTLFAPVDIMLLAGIETTRTDDFQRPQRFAYND